MTCPGCGHPAHKTECTLYDGPRSTDYCGCLRNAYRARPGHIYVSKTAPLLRWLAMADGRLYDISTGGKNIIPYDPELHEETIA